MKYKYYTCNLATRNGIYSVRFTTNASNTLTKELKVTSLEIELDGDEDMFLPLRCQRGKIEIYNLDGDVDPMDFFNIDGTYNELAQVHIADQAGDTVFDGYVSPEIRSNPLLMQGESVELQLIDKLSLAEFRRYTISSSTRLDSRVTLRSLLYSSLENCGYRSAYLYLPSAMEQRLSWEVPYYTMFESREEKEIILNQSVNTSFNSVSYKDIIEWIARLFAVSFISNCDNVYAYSPNESAYVRVELGDQEYTPVRAGIPSSALSPDAFITTDASCSIVKRKLVKVASSYNEDTTVFSINDAALTETSDGPMDMTIPISDYTVQYAQLADKAEDNTLVCSGGRLRRIKNNLHSGGFDGDIVIADNNSPSTIVEVRGKSYFVLSSCSKYRGVVVTYKQRRVYGNAWTQYWAINVEILVNSRQANVVWENVKTKTSGEKETEVTLVALFETDNVEDVHTGDVTVRIKKPADSGFFIYTDIKVDISEVDGGWVREIVEEEGGWYYRYYFVFSGISENYYHKAPGSFAYTERINTIYEDYTVELKWAPFHKGYSACLLNGIINNGAPVSTVNDQQYEAWLHAQYNAQLSSIHTIVELPVTIDLLSNRERPLIVTYNNSQYLVVGCSTDFSKGITNYKLINIL